MFNRRSLGNVALASRRGIYFTDFDVASEAPRPVRFLKFESRQVTQVGTVEKTVSWTNTPGFAISPDGRWLLYTSLENTDADLMLMDVSASRWFLSERLLHARIAVRSPSRLVADSSTVARAAVQQAKALAEAIHRNGLSALSVGVSSPAVLSALIETHRL